jgi:hypothetical protein
MSTNRTVVNNSVTGLSSYQDLPIEPVVGTTTSQSLTNKKMEDATVLFYQTGDPTRLAKLSFPSIAVGTTTYQFPATTTGTIATLANTQTLSNKTLQDSTCRFGDDIVPTKLFQFQCSGLTAGVTKTYTAPDQDGTMIVSDITNRVHNSVSAWDSTNSKYVDNQDGWVDLIGDFGVRSGGGANPFVLTLFDTPTAHIYDWATANSAGQISQGYSQYHIPHDYAPGTDTFFHLHLSTNQAVSTTCAFLIYASFTKANQVLQPSVLLATITKMFNAATDQYKIFVVEVPLSTAGGSATTIDTNQIETDGILHVHIFYQRGANGDNMGNNVPTFIHYADVHYKSTSRGTKNKVSPFNT